MLRIDKLEIVPLPPLSLELADGACIAVAGPSGSGKTRFLRAIADLDPAQGRIYLDGEERSEVPGPRWRQAVRYVAAEPAWWTATAREAMPAAPEAGQRAVRLAASLGLGAEMLDQPIAALSTGERQRLALVRALADQPRVLLLDEPTSALDTANAALAEELIRYQLLSGRSVLIASHDEAMLQRLTDARLELAPTRLSPAHRSSTT